jgi:hypothetical protein
MSTRRGGTQLGFGRAAADELANLIVDDEELVHGHAALVSGPSARGTPDRRVPRGVRRHAARPAQPHQVFRRRRGRDRARRARPADEALREDGHQRRRDEERLHAEVQQPGDRSRRIVGVHRAEEEMPGLGRFQRDVRGLVVADLSDENDVGVLPQDRAQPGRERDPGLGVDGHLVHPGKLVFDRILDREDVLRR